MNAVTVTKSVSFSSRVKRAFKGIIGGFVLLVIAGWLLYRNEGSSLQTTKSLTEVREQVITISAETVDDLNENKLVYVQGKLQTNETVADEEFGIPAQQNTIKLIRKVEMYQREESSRTQTKDKIGGGQEEITTYDYKKKWSDTLIDSSFFYEKEGHRNPVAMGIEGTKKSIRNALIGAFTIGSSQIEKMNREEEFSYQQDYLPLLSTYKDVALLSNNKLYINPQKKPNPSSPEVGDMRITWFVVPVDEVSIIAQQSSNSFRAYQAKAGDSISMISRGNVSPDQMILEAQKANNVKTRFLRLLGIVLMIIGFNMLLSIIPTISSVVPLFGWIIGAGVGIVSFFLGLSMGIVVIGISRLRFRPITGIILLIVAAGLVFGIKFLKKTKKKAVIEK